MNVKQFRAASRLLSGLLIILGAFSIAILILGLVLIIFTDMGSSFTVNLPENPIISFNDSRVTDADHAFTSLIVAPLFLAVYSYILFKGSFLFDRLADGKTPFTYDFAESVKGISLLLIAFDIILPLLYSLIVNIRAEEGFYFSFGLTSSFLIGLILYIVSGVLKYGISLQELSDDTV
ncbi:DUF2975 domain-containing protein [Alkalibacterium sp. 20]|uniref:DUF2975 domain-containing protein n=1 Tax=Alkalibacterium sp. 20 TaxID=1798803 RepID=UPI0008FFE2FE|nr:DUF2975 domain-containing protein [Alkalibacterium sp. 20]OJF93740.1 hypothetical protein AX762_08620 [Alkalibacterium sp. 20]